MICLYGRVFTIVVHKCNCNLSLFVTQLMQTQRTDTKWQAGDNLS